MIRKIIRYTDYDNNPQTDEVYFHMNRIDSMELMGKHADFIEKIREIRDENASMEEFVKRIFAEKNYYELAMFFRDLVLLSYGKKSADGKSFLKSKEEAEKFGQTAAFSALVDELLTRPEVMKEFLNNLIPQNVSEDTNISPVF